MARKTTPQTAKAKRDAVARLRRFRERHPLLLDRHIAEAVGVTPCTVNKWMNGVNAPNGPVRDNLASYIDAVDKNRAPRDPAPARTPHHPHLNPDDGQPSSGPSSARVALIVRLMGPLSPEEVEAVAVAALDLMGGGA